MDADARAQPRHWVAAIGTRGLGRDPEVEAILDHARERTVDRLIEALQTSEAATAPQVLRATIRAYSGFAEAASIEWLERGRLTREQLQTLLVQGFLSIVRDVLPGSSEQGAIVRCRPADRSPDHLPDRPFVVLRTTFRRTMSLVTQV